MVDIAAGGAHSACITASGELFTWGKGRYGRLGHGDSEDQLKPKLVSDQFLTQLSDRTLNRLTQLEQTHTHSDGDIQLTVLSVCLIQVDALQGHRVIDVACGSGDAQTLCLTDDDMVWSWGDGDYGKLGRGGSDGCKIPMKVRQFTPQRAREVSSSSGALYCPKLLQMGRRQGWL